MKPMEVILVPSAVSHHHSTRAMGYEVSSSLGILLKIILYKQLFMPAFIICFKLLTLYCTCDTYLFETKKIDIFLDQILKNKKDTKLKAFWIDLWISWTYNRTLAGRQHWFKFVVYRIYMHKCNDKKKDTIFGDRHKPHLATGPHLLHSPRMYLGCSTSVYYKINPVIYKADNVYI